jgi:CDP-4-dehydro-6-deoxyglucose reductase, E3
MAARTALAVLANAKKFRAPWCTARTKTKALSDDEEAQGLVLTCCATAQSDVVLESKQVTAEGGLPVKKMPVRVVSLEKKSHDVIVLKLQLPANDVMKFHAGQYIEFLLRDGSRRSYSMANAPAHPRSRPAHGGTAHPPHARRQVHRPGVHHHERKRHPAGRRPVWQFLSARRQRQAHGAAGLGHWLCPHQGADRAHAAPRHHPPATLYWGGRRPADLYMADWVEARLAEMPQLRYVPVISNAEAQDQWTGRTGFVHQAVLQDFPDLSGHQVYACGAPIVVDSAKRDYVAQGGLPEEEFFADSFTSEADKAKA